MTIESAAVRQEHAVSTRLFLLVVASAVFMTTMTGSMVNVILPIIRAEFAASAAQVGWVATGYVLAYAIGIPLYGRISDLFGVRSVFTLGLLGFALGGLICAFAPSFVILIVGRTVQGIGGAAVPALASVAVAKVLPAGSRGGALGLVASTVGIGSSIGPVVGGLAGQFLGWRALFIGSLVLMLLVIPLAQRVLPNDKAQGERRFDLVGGILLGLLAGLFLFGITQGQVAGFDAISSWGSFLGAAVALAGFIWRITHTAHPFVSPALFKNRPYVAAVLIGFFTMLANLSALVFAPLLVVEVNQLTPAAAGLVLTPGAITVALLSPVTGRLSDRMGVRPLIVTGLIVLSFSLLFISTFAGASPLLITLGMVGVGAGGAFIQSPMNNTVANSLSSNEVGSGMGISAGASFLGAGTGPALIGAFLAARQESQGSALNPLYTFGAAPFSDAFLAMALVLVIPLVFTTRLRSSAKVPSKSP